MKVLLLIPILFLLISCNSPEKMAKTAISENLKLTLNDFKSYEPVEFGKLDSSMSKYEKSPRGQALLDSSDKYSGAYKHLNDRLAYESDPRIALVILNLANKRLEQSQSFVKQFNKEAPFYKPQFIGWKMQHSFRAKNLAGNFGINHFLFYLNPELTKVIQTSDISEKALETK